MNKQIAQLGCPAIYCGKDWALSTVKGTADLKKKQKNEGRI